MIKAFGQEKNVCDKGRASYLATSYTEQSKQHPQNVLYPTPS